MLEHENTLDTANNSRPELRTALVAVEQQQYDIDIAALSETRFSEEGSIREESTGYTFFWKGLPEGVPRMHGVGFAIKNSLLKDLPESPIGVNERLMTLRIPLSKNRHATIFSVYAPKPARTIFITPSTTSCSVCQDVTRSSSWGISMQELAGII